MQFDLAVVFLGACPIGNDEEREEWEDSGTIGVSFR